MRTILVSAYACEPLKGSEQGVGWNWVLQMAKSNIVHVITRANNQAVIEANLPTEFEGKIFFHYFDTNNFIKGLKNKAKGLYFYYLCWQIGIMPIARNLNKELKFDYSIHLTMGSIWMPTFLPLFKIPFIWGPVGGGEGIPKRFLSTLPIKNRIIQSLRYVLKYLVYLNPSILISSARAVSIITRTNNTRDFIPAFYKEKCEVYLETSMERSIFAYNKTESKVTNKITNLIITGRLVPFKNVITAVRAMQYIPEKEDCHLTIIGSGPEKMNILEEVEKLELSQRITFIEETTRENVLHSLQKSDIYLFPSLREGGSWALMEAMAIGLPVICLKWSGMEIITDDSSAIRLPVSDPEQMPRDMGKAICNLIKNPNLRKEMGKAGRERIRNKFNWDSKGDFIENHFRMLDKQLSGKFQGSKA